MVYDGRKADGASTSLLDGHPIPRFDELRGGAVQFIPGGHRIAFVAGRAGKERVVIDGVPGREYEGVYTPLLFSPDGKHYAYGARRGSKAFMVRDGKEGPEVEDIDNNYTGLFSPDGNRLGYAAGKGGKDLFVIDGTVLPGRYRWIEDYTPMFSADSKHFAFVALKNGKLVVVIDGVPGPAMDDVPQAYGSGGDMGDSYHCPIAFSPKGGRVAYVATKADKWYAVLDGVLCGPYDSVGFPTFSKDGKRVAYTAERKGKHLVVVNRIEGATYDECADPVFYGTGHDLAYCARKGRTWSFIRDDVPTVHSDEEMWLVSSPDGRHLLLFMQKGGKECVMLDGKRSQWYDQIGDTIAFSPSGKTLAYGAQRHDDHFVVVNGVEGPPFAKLQYQSLAFSRDGRHVAYGARSHGKWVAVLDGIAGPGYDDIAKLVFQPDGRLEFLAKKGPELVRVREAVTPVKGGLMPPHHDPHDLPRP